jgi:hypothetical protein
MNEQKSAGGFYQTSRMLFTDLKLGGKAMKTNLSVRKTAFSEK